MAASNSTIESRTIAPSSTSTPGDSTERSTWPWMRQPCEISDCTTWAPEPTRPGGRPSVFVWIGQPRS